MHVEVNIKLLSPLCDNDIVKSSDIMMVGRSTLVNLAVVKPARQDRC